MGEVADDIIAGLMCSECGVYFEKKHGHPVLCAHCHKGCTQRGGECAPKARHAEL